MSVNVVASASDDTHFELEGILVRPSSKCVGCILSSLVENSWSWEECLNFVQDLSSRLVGLEFLTCYFEQTNLMDFKLRTFLIRLFIMWMPWT